MHPICFAIRGCVMQLCSSYEASQSDVVAPPHGGVGLRMPTASQHVGKKNNNKKKTTTNFVQKNACLLLHSLPTLTV